MKKALIILVVFIVLLFVPLISQKAPVVCVKAPCPEYVVFPISIFEYIASTYFNWRSSHLFKNERIEYK